MINKNVIFVFALFFLSIGFVSAVDYPQPYNQYVNDYANIFSNQENLYLQSLFADVEQNTTAQVVIVTIDSLNGSDISQYATDLGQNWEIGTKEKDNGLLILYSKQENKIYVATGYGLEGILPDSKVGRLLDANYVPLRDSGNVSQGIIAFSNVIHDTLIQNGDEIRASQNGITTISILPAVIFVVIVFLVIALIIYPFMSRKRKGFGDFMTFFFIDFLVRIIIYSIIFRGGSGRNSGSGGFGGGGFGGGSFGGGGAGR